MKNVTQHQLRVKCLDLVDSGILLLDSLLKDLVTQLSLNLMLRLVQSPLVHLLLFQTFQLLLLPSLEVIFCGAIPIGHS